MVIAMKILCSECCVLFLVDSCVGSENYIFFYSDGSSDSGVEEDKSPRKIDTPKKSEDGKVTRSVGILFH